MSSDAAPVLSGQSRKKSLFWVILLAVPVLFSAFFLLYAGQYYHADDTAASALHSDDSVTVSKTDYGWFFDGPSEADALVFYPGAKVDAAAYAPLLHSLASQGIDVCLVSMPLRFAFLGADRATHVMERHKYERWYLGGHSLGGAMAAAYAAENSDTVSGVILLAAYAPKRLDDKMLEVVIYGTEDGVLSEKHLETARKSAPKRYVEHRIDGGNHAQFGNYGAQSGDGVPRITAAQQQAETVNVVTEAIFE